MYANIISKIVNIHTMTSEAQAKIQKMIYNLTNENRSAAGRDLKDIIDIKVKDAFKREYTQVMQSFKENK